MTTTMRKTIVIFFLVTTLGFLNFCAGENTGKSFTWKIETDAGGSYLVGSIHLLKKSVYPLKGVIEDSFAQSDTLVVEADISDAKMSGQAMEIMQKGMYQDEETLKGNISEKTFQLTEKKLDELGMNIDGFKKFKPWMVALTLTSMQLMKLGFNPNYGIDKYFLEKASGKKEILELEGLDFQMKLFDSFSKEESEKFLLSTILEADQTAKSIDKMVDAWIVGDVKKMEELMTENIKKYPELDDFYTKIIDDRNEGMVEKITGYLKTGKTYFIVAGAAHMVGKKGIVQLLRDKGFTVTQL